MLKNLSMNMLAFIIQFAVSFYISPTIVSKAGASAYGFIGMANDFVSYASILATVFNSVATRFIANSFYKREYGKANHYFNSLIVANLVIAGVLGVAGVVLVPNLDNVLTIPASLVTDVKITFALIFLSYIITLVTLVFTTATFVTNRTDIQGIRNIINYMLRFATIVIFLNFVSVKIYWVALGTLIGSAVVAVINFNLNKKLTPELKIDLRQAKFSYTKELAMSGFWMAFTNVSVILMRGIDLTIANQMLGSHEMGLLSVARTMPNNLTAAINMVAPLFTPVFISFFADDDIDGLVKSVKKSIKTVVAMLFVPICGFIVFSYDFYSLWQQDLASDEIMIVTILSTITVIQALFNTVTSTTAQLSVVTNKLKVPVMVSLGTGVLNVIVVFILLYTTNLGIFAIVISSTVIMILRYVLFNSFYGAYILHKPLNTFIWDTCKPWLLLPLLFLTMIGYRILFPIHSWLELILAAVVCAVLGYIEVLLVYKRNMIITLINKIFK